MPNTREKLIELLNEADELVKELCGGLNDNHGNGPRADHLLANGVTVQQWISVKDRLPEEGVTVLVCGGRRGVYTAYMNCPDYWHKLNSTNHYCNPTHWMPLPQPPKEGADNG